MPSIREKKTKDGQRVFEIRVFHNGKRLSRNWTAPVGWSQSAINRAVLRYAADVEKQFKEGELSNRQQNIEKELEAEAERAKIMTVKKYAETVYLPSLKARVAGTSYSVYDSIIHREILSVIGDMKIVDVTAADLNKILTAYQLKGKAHSTVIKLYTVMQGLFKAAFMDYTIQINIFDRVQRPRRRENENIKTEPESLNANEVRRLLDVVETLPAKWKAYIQLSLRTGARRGELTGLYWSDVDWNEKTLHINRSLCYVTDRGVYEKTCKNGKSRVVALDDVSLECLKALKAEQLKNGILSKYVFTQTDSGEQMHPDTPTRYLDRLSKRYDLPHLHPHQLRHTFASLAITNGADVVSVSEILGHSDTAITLRTYAHANEESKKRAVDIFVKAISASNE